MARTKRAAKVQAPKRKRPEREGMARTFTDAELERCRVLSRHVERVARRLPWVRVLRELLLGEAEATVTPETALRLLASPASRYVPLPDFKASGIAWREHQCEQVHVKRGYEPELARFEDVSLTLRGPGRTEQWAARVTLDDADGVHRPRILAYPTQEGRIATAVSHLRSPLHLLAAATEQNATDLLWSVPAAAWFVLTGEAPTVEPVHAELQTAYDEQGEPMRTELVLRVQVFLTHRSAERALARARRLALHRQGLRGAFPMEPKTLALFAFVEEETERNAGVRPSWGTLLDLWDARQRKEWRYGDERSHLRRDYERAHRLLTQGAKTLEGARPVPRSSRQPAGRTR